MKVLLQRVREHPELADLDPAERRLALRGVLAPLVPPGEQGAAVDAVADAIDAFGPLTALMREPGVTDILVNGPDDVWVERWGRMEPSGVRFEDEASLVSLIERLVSEGGGRIDLAHPVADARLADGSRIHAVLPPVAPAGPLVSIRRLPADPLTLDRLAEGGCITSELLSQIRRLLEERRNIVVAGETGSGKTTMLGAFLAELPTDERVAVIEEVAELPLQGHRIRLVSRPPNLEGRGEVTLEDLVRASLRMRPDRIVVGEVRGAEALIALEAMTTGHDGAMLSVHAQSCAQALSRLSMLAARGAGVADAAARRELVEQAVHAVVHMTRSGGRRRVTEILTLI